MNRQTVAHAPKKTAEPQMGSILQRTAVHAIPEKAAQLALPTQVSKASRFEHDFSQVPIHYGLSGVIQPKLTISQPGDPLEQEADRVADVVMRMPLLQQSPNAYPGRPFASGVPNARSGLIIQRLESKEDGEVTEQLHEAVDQPISITAQRPAQEEVEESEGTETIQRKQANNESMNRAALPIQESSLREEGGRTLPQDVKSDMEQRFSADFSSIHLHTNSRANALSRGIGARAFTHRNHIYFGANEYQPSMAKGRHLLAHELTHTIQQGAAAVRGPHDGLSVTSPSNASPPLVQRSIDRTIRVENVGLGTLRTSASPITGEPYENVFSDMERGAYASILAGNPVFSMETKDTWYYYRPVFHGSIYATRSYAKTLLGGDVYYQAATDVYNIDFRYEHLSSEDRGPIEGVSLSFRSGSQEQRELTISGGAKATFDVLELSASVEEKKSKGVTEESGVSSDNVYEFSYAVKADYRVSAYVKSDFERGVFGVNSKGTGPHAASGTAELGTISVFDNTNDPDNLTP